MIFLWDVTKKKEEKRPDYRIEEWHKSTPYDIFWNQYTYLTVCLLIVTCHHTNHFIIVCGKWKFDSKFQVTFPLTHDCLNYTCRDNDTDKIKCFGVLHVIRTVPSNFFKEY